jgi:integrase
MQEKAKKVKRRRSRGSGNLLLRGDSWIIRYQSKPQGGKQIHETVGRVSEGFTRQMAEEVLLERLLEVKKGLTKEREAEIPTIEDAARRWFQREASLKNLSPSSLENTRSCLECHLLPALGDLKLDELTPQYIEQYMINKANVAPTDKGAFPTKGKVASRRKKPLSQRTINMQCEDLGRIYDWAIREGLVSSNPMDQVERRSSKRSEKKLIEPMDLKDVKALIASAPNEDVEAIVTVLSAIGLRIGELFALRRSDFDHQEQTLAICGTMAVDSEGKIRRSDLAKTQAGFRKLKLSDQMTNVLIEQVKRNTDRGIDRPSGPLFPNIRKDVLGTHRQPNSFSDKTWKTMIRKAGIEEGRYTPHALRHTYASECIAKGVPITNLSYMIGHANPATTLQIYASVLDRNKVGIADNVELYSGDDLEALDDPKASRDSAD